ncbi:TPA: hypothetical protein PTV74_003214 [Clostridium botulinum]|nr:hypothetical protein [Clostridium botulinum]HDK7206369.1 hypothetical protein [Clostridium botulinum]HDK7210105.1 hypothetical protein [Clostridium botulinum]HDK7265554.1 hypothetical protein [Clostridium botulinum]HDK7269402.1 hypothetical protein [Clostridium botulinum]
MDKIKEIQITDKIKKIVDKEEELEKKIKQAEGMLSGLILKNPDILTEYTINKKILSEDALFYIGIVERLYSKGIECVDEVHFVSEVEELGLKEKYDILGGYNTIKELKNIIEIQNSDGIFDDWTKWNLIKEYYEEKGILNIVKHWDKLNKMTSSQLVDYIEYQTNDVDIKVANDIEFETLDLTDKEINDIKSGANMGVNFGKHCPLLNYMTMGLPKGDLTMFASYTNGGKSSFVMNNIIIPIAEQRKKVAIISNEQQSMVYKLLLQIYVLTEKLDYWSLTRKKLKSGQWSKKDEEMIEKARKIIATDYAPYITFAKVYDYDIGKVKRVAKKLSKTGLEVLIYDTMKYSGETESTWLSLLNDSKALFQVCSKENVAGVVTFQLAQAYKNRIRVLDTDCLSNGKQVAEVFSEMIGFRDIWEDEFDEETYDIKPYRLKKDSNGRYTNEKEYITLDKDKKYKIFFHFKTRNDEVGNALIYEFKGHLNKWYEVGRCTPHQKNRY